MNIAKQFSKYLILIAIVAIGLGVAYVFAWTGPPQPPPGGNTPTPLNVGINSQIKTGGIAVSSLVVTGIATTDAPEANKVCFTSTGLLGACPFTGTVIGPGCSILGGSTREFNDPANVSTLGLTWSATKNTYLIASISYSNNQGKTMDPATVTATGLTQSGSISTSVPQNVTTTYSLSVVDSQNAICPASTVVDWKWRSYWAVSPTSLDSSALDTYSEVSALTSFGKSSLDIYIGTHSINNNTGDNFIYFLCPKSLCPASPAFTVDNAFGGTAFVSLGEISNFKNEFFVSGNINNATTIYYAFRSESKMNSPQTLQVE